MITENDVNVLIMNHSLMHRPQAAAAINMALQTDYVTDFTCTTIINVPKTHADVTQLQMTMHSHTACSIEMYTSLPRAVTSC